MLARRVVDAAATASRRRHVQLSARASSAATPHGRRSTRNDSSRGGAASPTRLPFQSPWRRSGRDTGHAVNPSCGCLRRVSTATAPVIRRDTTRWVRELGQPGDTVTLQGWVKSARNQKTVAFLEIGDGTSVNGVQVVVPAEEKASFAAAAELSTGCSVRITGAVVDSPAKGQRVEVHASQVDIVGTCDAKAYPLQKKRHSLEFLRDIVHLRPRSNVIGAVSRVRNTLAMSLHDTLQGEGFINVHTPVITSNDCEGAGDLFTVSTTAGADDTPDDDDDGGFFGTPAYLTVSGQLQAETFASAMSRVYTFGPTFRAENSHTSRHLAEFWMLEPEMAFASLDDVVSLAERCVVASVKALLERSAEDVEFFAKRVDKALPERLDATLRGPFARLTYTEAVDILLGSGHTFELPVSWGDDLSSEHERYLAEVYCQGPVFVTDYPASIKPFYMRQNDDGKTVGAVDLLVPGVGEIVGGSAREERVDLLEAAMRSHGVLESGDLDWYVDLRRFGSVPHAGWGLGFERLVKFCTGIDNIRDAIPVPRAPGLCKL